MAIIKKGTPLITKSTDPRKKTLTYKRTGSVRGVKVPRIPVSASTRDIEDYTTTYTIIRYTNIYGNIKLELKDNHSLAVIYMCCCLNTVKAKKQLDYIYKKYGKRKTAKNIIDIPSEFNYNKVPYEKKDMADIEHKEEEEVNIEVVKALQEEENLRLEKERILNSKKKVIESFYKLVPVYIKDAKIEVTHNSTSLVTAIISSPEILQGEHKLTVDYNTLECTYFLNGKKRKVKKSLELMIK